MPLLLPRFPEGLRRYLALLGEGGPSEVSDELFASITLAPWDLRTLIGERPWWIRANAVAGGAGVRSEILIANPANSGVLSVIEGFIVDFSAGDNIVTLLQVQGVPANFGALGAVGFRDTRLFGGAAPALRATTSVAVKIAGAATAGQIFYRTNLTNPANQQHLHLALSPGYGIDFQASADNLGHGMSVWGYERQARAEELNLT